MEQLTLENELLAKDIREYFELKNQIDELTNKQKELNSKIVEQMKALDTKKFEDGEYSATLALKESIKYTDERKIMAMIRNDFSAEDASRYIVEVIDAKAFNQLLKNSPSVAETFKESYTTNKSTSLTVKKL